MQFYKVEPEDKIGIIEVSCTRLEPGHTKVQVSYEYIGLSAKGNAFIAGFTAVEYRNFIAEWEDLLVTYFRSTC